PIGELEPHIRRYWKQSNMTDKKLLDLLLTHHIDREKYVLPLVSQSDPGTENFGLVNGHTLLRHYHDPSLAGTLQHRWMNRKKNVLPEIGWSQLRHRWSPGFENILDYGVNGDITTKPCICRLVFRWIFIPWLQLELDRYREPLNNTAKRSDRNKILPHGVPNHIFEFPDEYGILDFKVQLKPGSVEHIRQLYAPRNHKVFQWVPPDFHDLAVQFHTQIGSPAINRDNVWGLYSAILNRFEHLDDVYAIPATIDYHWGYALTMARDDYWDNITLLPNLVPLPGEEQGYDGGVNGGHGLSLFFRLCCIIKKLIDPHRRGTN
ncbi:hypothetical protein C8R45DRAFT_824067, partial [Mycena sanguinolenta]